ncbi:hypothetical protein TorRG33x02_147130 [Trema orientale]|uniref:Uncharacterized protein n=1 Tax=Trema orientale TaxID=63057 RepID=A0A2P5EVK6_TREOI|nr:hypothetical protein TorRG33x02_147130 [Trema orientale]
MATCEATNKRAAERGGFSEWANRRGPRAETESGFLGRTREGTHVAKRGSESKTKSTFVFSVLGRNNGVESGPHAQFFIIPTIPTNGRLSKLYRPSLGEYTARLVKRVDLYRAPPTITD